NDVWVSELGALKFHFNGNGCLDESIHVCVVVNANGSWNFDWLLTILRRGVVDSIRACNLPLRELRVNQLSWKWMVVGKFSMLKSTIHAVRDCEFAHSVWNTFLPIHYWNRPDLGWVKLNVDGSVSIVISKAAIGGIVRDSNWKWLTGFAMVTGMTKVFQVEARAVVEGLKLAWMKCYKHVEINCDNALLIDTICNGFGSISNIRDVTPLTRIRHRIKVTRHYRT
ncbi:hypothetical protein Gohar_025504, partial [Gossypium harknessii]|nr:hypothetical protein [Gossypium harknessii]